MCGAGGAPQGDGRSSGADLPRGRARGHARRGQGEGNGGHGGAAEGAAEGVEAHRSRREELGRLHGGVPGAGGGAAGRGGAQAHQGRTGQGAVPQARPHLPGPVQQVPHDPRRSEEAGELRLQRVHGKEGPHRELQVRRRGGQALAERAHEQRGQTGEQSKRHEIPVGRGAVLLHPGVHPRSRAPVRVPFPGLGRVRRVHGRREPHRHAEDAAVLRVGPPARAVPVPHPAGHLRGGRHPAEDEPGAHGGGLARGLHEGHPDEDAAGLRGATGPTPRGGEPAAAAAAARGARRRRGRPIGARH
mmetsp:Transcript_30224/g.84445  ORF Transcript_30224/g.84445 Transcript_30224/m.84445 type:complete len:302 (-) Transcript_30224:648-1553(-)